jgi:hypothetical protein
MNDPERGFNQFLKTGEPEPEPAGFTGSMADRFKPVNKPNCPTGL